MRLASSSRRVVVRGTNAHATVEKKAKPTFQSELYGTPRAGADWTCLLPDRVQLLQLLQQNQPSFDLPSSFLSDPLATFGKTFTARDLIASFGYAREYRFSWGSFSPPRQAAS